MCQSIENITRTLNEIIKNKIDQDAMDKNNTKNIKKKERTNKRHGKNNNIIVFKNKKIKYKKIKKMSIKIIKIKN